jgi:HEAT repeat protein
LKDVHSAVRINAVQVLGEMEDIRAVGPLVAVLQDADWHVRESAVKALGEIKDTHAVEPLIAALKDQDGFVRNSAAKALGEIKDTRAIEPLMAVLNDQFSGDGVVEALGKIGTPAVESLVAALKDQNPVRRNNAAKALGFTKEQKAIPNLIEALKDWHAGGSAAEVLRSAWLAGSK